MKLALKLPSISLGNLGTKIPRIDPKAFGVSFSALLVLSAAMGFKIISADQARLASEAQKESLPPKVLAVLDVSSYVEEPIKHIEGQEAGGMTGSPLHAEDTASPVLKSTERVEGIFEETPFGYVPVKRASDGMTIFDAYKMLFAPQATTKGFISIVMVDYGLSDDMTLQSLSALPASTTFVLSPYAGETQDKIDRARSSGHEVWLNLPVQSKGYGNGNDSGPLTLLSGLNSEQNNIRLQKTLALAHGYAGVTFSNLPDFRESPDGLKDVLMTLAGRGIPLSLASVDETATLSDLADASSLPYTQNGLWLNGDEGEAVLRSKLAQLESMATEKFQAVAFIRPQPKLFSVLKDWGGTLSAKGLEFAPLSASVPEKK